MLALLLYYIYTITSFFSCLTFCLFFFLCVFQEHQEVYYFDDKYKYCEVMDVAAGVPCCLFTRYYDTIYEFFSYVTVFLFFLLFFFLSKMAGGRGGGGGGGGGR